MLPHPAMQGLEAQPILGAIDSMAAHREGYSPRCSCTMRAARSRASGNASVSFHGSILSDVGASTKPGVVHSRLWIGMALRESRSDVFCTNVPEV